MGRTGDAADDRRRLGVSRTTVSNANNRPDQLAAELRERILATADEPGYSGPDPAARRLRSAERNVIALMFEDLWYAVTDPAAVLFLQGMTEATAPRALAPLLLPRGGRSAASDGPRAVVDAFVLYFHAAQRGHGRGRARRGLPVVVVDEPPGGDGLRRHRRPRRHPGRRHTWSASATGGSPSLRTASATTRSPAASTPAGARTRPSRSPASAWPAARTRSARRPHVDDVPLYEHDEDTIRAGEAGAGAARCRAAADRRDRDEPPAGHRRHAGRARGGPWVPQPSVSGFDDVPAAEVADPRAPASRYGRRARSRAARR